MYHNHYERNCVITENGITPSAGLVHDGSLLFCLAVKLPIKGNLWTNHLLQMVAGTQHTHTANQALVGNNVAYQNSTEYNLASCNVLHLLQVTNAFAKHNVGAVHV